MRCVLCVLQLVFSLEAEKEAYGVDLELLDFQSLPKNIGFVANFALHKDVNYIFFGLMRKGDNYNHDRLIARLNTEYSMNCSQKRGSSFTIKKQYKMQNLSMGTYYFQLESQDGNIYKSNQFSQAPTGLWIIKRTTGISKAKSVAEKITWLEKYKFYVIGVSVVLIACLIFFGIKAYKK